MLPKFWPVFAFPAARSPDLILERAREESSIVATGLDGVWRLLELEMRHLREERFFLGCLQLEGEGDGEEVEETESMEE